MFVDSHAHLDSFQDDLAEVLERARRAGVTRILTIGCLRDSGESIRTFREIVETQTGVLGALGVHPHDARFYQQALGDQIESLMDDPRIVAWGEIGLDFHYNNSPPQVQIEAFRDQLRRARRTKSPVIIHCREAEDETCRILEEEFRRGPGGILHCFTGDWVMAKRCLALGFYVSLGGILTFPKAENLRETARRLPGERLLIETDSPYLAPVPYRGKRNEPAHLVKVAEILSRVRGAELEEMAAVTTNNFQQLFSLEGA